MEQSQNTSASADIMQGQVDIDTVQSQIEHLTALGSQYRSDAGFRSRLLSDPHGILNEKGFDIPKELEVRVVANTDELFHIAFPLDPNATMSDEALALVAGGGGSASTVGSVSTAGTVVTTASSVGSVGSAGSAA